MAIFPDFGTIFGAIPLLGSFLRMMSPYPTPIFGSPRQRESRENNPDSSWWHIPVSIEKKRFWQPDVIERCEAHIYYKDITDDGPGVRLRWHSLDNEEGDSQTALELGKNKFIPIARRDEKIKRTFITNQDYWRGNPQKRELSPGSYQIRLVVESGPNKWEAPHVYNLRVPEDSIGNGFFTLEIIQPERDW